MPGQNPCGALKHIESCCESGYQATERFVGRIQDDCCRSPYVELAAYLSSEVRSRIVKMEPFMAMSFLRRNSHITRETDSRQVPTHSPISWCVRARHNLVPSLVGRPEAENSNRSLATLAATDGVPLRVRNRAHAWLYDLLSASAAIFKAEAWWSRTVRKSARSIEAILHAYKVSAVIS